MLHKLLLHLFYRKHKRIGVIIVDEAKFSKRMEMWAKAWKD